MNIGEERKMPLTKKGKRIKGEFIKEYGKKKGESIFYAWENKNKTRGVKRGSK